MRSTKKTLVDGDTLIVSWFAWFPVSVRNLRNKTVETRWLEKVKVLRRFNGRYYTWWTNEEFIDD